MRSSTHLLPNAPDNMMKEILKKRAIERVRENPDHYIELNSDQQSDPDVCRTALLSIDLHSQSQAYATTVLIRTLQHMNDVQQHRNAFLRFVDFGHAGFIEKYVTHFQPSVMFQSRDFVIEALHRDRFAHVFSRLPSELRSDSELIQLTLETIHEICISRLLLAIPPEALVEQYEDLVVQTLDKDLITFSHDKVPAAFWHKKAFIMKWIAKGKSISASSIPKELSSDREICLALYQSQAKFINTTNTLLNGTLLREVLNNWLPKSLLSDKEFVLECLRYDTRIFHHCTELHGDVDLLIEAAYCDIDRFQMFLSEIKRPAAV